MKVLSIMKAISVSPFILCLIYSLLLYVDPTRPLALELLQENNLIELITFGALFLAAIVAGRLLLNSKDMDLSRFSLIFYGLFCAGAFITAMEEIAWGQWFFSFDTPSFIALHNEQNELTLHNLTPLQGHSEYFRVFFGYSGLVGLAFSMTNKFKQIAPPLCLTSWFIIITVLSTLDLILDFDNNLVQQIFNFSKNTTLGWYINTMSEFVEMLIGLTSFIYISERFDALKN